MCGIAGIIYRHPQLYHQLGTDLLSLIQPLESRGTDGCGVGVYTKPVAPHQMKILLLAAKKVQWEVVRQWLTQLGEIAKFETVGDGKRVTLQLKEQTFNWEELKSNLAANFQVHLISLGQQLEIYKEVGAAKNLFQRFDLKTFIGSHGIGHTRMATESIVDTHHSHPFTSAPDLCIVHNGQISNYYKLRYTLEKQGIEFETNNDSEALAHYIHHQLAQNNTLEQALQNLLKAIDGTYTFLIATADKIALVRDKFAAKPAVIYESENLIAIASEYRCFLNLPNFDPTANIYEPDAGEIKIWPISLNSSAFSAPQRFVSPIY